MTRRPAPARFSLDWWLLTVLGCYIGAVLTLLALALAGGPALGGWLAQWYAVIPAIIIAAVYLARNPSRRP